MKRASFDFIYIYALKNTRFLVLHTFFYWRNFAYGIKIDKDTHEAIVGATISDETKHKPLTVTDAEGRFVIPKRGDAQHSTQHLKITYIGYKPLVVTAVANGRYLLEAEVSKLGEVVVTA